MKQDSEDDEEDDDHCNNLALFQRHEIQTSWTLIGNGAFSEVYSVQNIRLLDGGFVDPIQQEAREKLRDDILHGRTSSPAMITNDNNTQTLLLQHHISHNSM